MSGLLQGSACQIYQKWLILVPTLQQATLVPLDDGGAHLKCDLPVCATLSPLARKTIETRGEGLDQSLVGQRRMSSPATSCGSTHSVTRHMLACSIFSRAGFGCLIRSQAGLWACGPRPYSSFQVSHPGWRAWARIRWPRRSRCFNWSTNLIPPTLRTADPLLGGLEAASPRRRPSAAASMPAAAAILGQSLAPDLAQLTFNDVWCHAAGTGACTWPSSGCGRGSSSSGPCRCSMPAAAGAAAAAGPGPGAGPGAVRRVAAPVRRGAQQLQAAARIVHAAVQGPADRCSWHLDLPIRSSGRGEGRPH